MEIPGRTGLKIKTGETFEECKKVIMEEDEQGWRLKQAVNPFNEKTGVSASYCYQITLSRQGAIRLPAVKINTGIVIVLGGRQPTCVLFLASADFSSLAGPAEFFGRRFGG